MTVNSGIDQPPSINEPAAVIFRNKRGKKLTVADYMNGILNHDISILSQAITLVESALPLHQKIAREITGQCLPHSGNSVRVGITGVPGVGKSTFIETLGLSLIRNGHRLAVLAIDPSSELSKGSILGDKTRMESLSAESNAYIRPSPSAGSLGGVARKTRESIILCEAAGFDTIFVETVGVGQSETAVHSMTDFFLLLMLAGAGDELQGIKRGIMEMADLVVINKAEDDNKKNAERARTEYLNALHLFPPPASGFIPKVLTCSARNNTGINEIWTYITDYIDYTKNNGHFLRNRSEQSRYWMIESINESLQGHFYNNLKIKEKIARYEKMVLDGSVSSFIAAGLLLNEYFNSKNQEGS